jgi:hypothetical protein
VNIGFHPAPSSRSGTSPLPAPRIPPRPRTLRELCVSAFSSPNISLFNFKLLALFTLKNEGSVVEGSTASPERSRRVNCFHPNSHRITSFAHPHPLTPIESNSCKKQGGGVPLTPNLGRRASSPCATRRNSRNSIPFIALLHNLRTPPGGGSILSTHPDACRPISANPFRIHAYKKQGGLLLIYRQCSPLQLPIGP